MMCDTDSREGITLSEMTRALRLRTSGKRAHDFVRTASRIAKEAKEAGGRASRWHTVRETQAMSGADGFVDMKDAVSGKVRNGASAVCSHLSLRRDASLCAVYRALPTLALTWNCVCVCLCACVRAP